MLKTKIEFQIKSGVVFVAIFLCTFFLSGVLHASASGLWGHYGSDGHLWAPLNVSYDHMHSAVEPVDKGLGTFASDISSFTTGDCLNKRVEWTGYIQATWTDPTTYFGFDQAADQWVRIIIDGVDVFEGGLGVNNGWREGVTQDVSVNPVSFVTGVWYDIQITTGTFGMADCTAAMADLYWGTDPVIASMVGVPVGNLSPGDPPISAIQIPSTGKEQFSYKVSGLSFEEDIDNTRNHFSVAARVNTTDNDGSIFFNDDDTPGPSGNKRIIDLRIRNGNAEFYYARNYDDEEALVTGPAIDDGNPYMVIAVVNENEIELFVNGSSAGTDQLSVGAKVSVKSPYYVGVNYSELIGGGIPENTNAAYVYSSCSLCYFDGSIDDLRFYHRLLGPTEINLWGDGSGTAPSSIGLVGHWDFNTNENDSTRLRNHGDLTSGASVAGGKLQLNGTSQYMRIDDDAFTLNELHVPPGAIVTGGPKIFEDEFVLIWSNPEGRNLKVTNIDTGFSETISPRFDNVRKNNKIVSSYGRITNGGGVVIPACSGGPCPSSTLRLRFEDASPSEKLADGGLALIMPYEDIAQPLGRVSIFTGTERAHRGIVPAAIFPVQNIGSFVVEPLLIYHDGETGYTADQNFRPNYVSYLTGNDYATKPSPFDYLDDIGATLYLPDAPPITLNDDREQNTFWTHLFNLVRAAAPANYPFSDAPDSWYPVFGRNGRNLDILSPNYVANVWAGEEILSSGETVPSLPAIPGDTQWVALQAVSSNFGPTSGSPESIQFTSAVGMFSTLDFDEIPSTINPPTLVAVSQSACSADIDVNWTEPAVTSDIEEYHVYRCDGVGCDPEIVGIDIGTRPVGTSFFPDDGSVGGLVDGTSYSYVLRSHDHDAPVFSGYSATMTETYVECIPTVDADIIATPLRVPVGGFTDLAWSSVAASSCVVSDDVSPDLIDITTPMCPGLACNGSRNNVGPITQNTDFTIQCTPVDGTEVDSQSVTTSVIIIIEE